MSKTLLLADDSVTIQRVIELTFAHEDVRVVSVSDGKRAVDWMEHERPDIVLVDVEAPELDGYAVASHVKSTARLEQVPVLLLAGAFEPVDQDKARASGCDGVLIKPFEPQQLVSRVKALLAHADAPATRSESPRRFGESEASTVRPFPGPVPARASEPAPLSLPTARHDFESPSATPEPLEPPTMPVWQTAGVPGTVALRPGEGPGPGGPKVSLVNAFSALLAAEQSSHPVAAAPPAPQISDATIEDAVRRVLSRMTDDLVRRIVIDTAERLIREEIEKIKSSSD